MSDEGEVRSDGNSHLCGMDMQLWGMVHTIALQWSTLVIFKWRRYNVPERSDEWIDFFVPKDSVHRYEICEFIEGHMKKWRRAPQFIEDMDHYWPGCNATIHCTTYTFSGIHPEMPAEVSEAMCKGWVQSFMMDFGAPKRQARIMEQARQRMQDDPEFVETLLGSMSPTRLEKLMKTET